MSSGNTVSFKLTASERDAVEAYRKLIREGPEALTKALAAYGRKSKQVAKDTEQGWSGSMVRMAASYVSIEKGISLIERGWAAVLNKMEETERRSRTVSLTLEQAGRRLAIQGGLSADQEKAAIQQALAIGKKYGASGEAVAAGFTQLISSGSAASDVIQGGGGEALVQTAVASNMALDAESLRGAAQSASLFLSATGQRLTPENIKRLGVGAQSLFQGTNFQLSELARFAEESGQLSTTTGATQEELLGTFAMLRNRLPAAKASTAFRSFATKLVGLREEGPQAEALKQIGLGVGDVDFVGESYQDVLTKLTKGLGGTDAATAKQVTKALFGEEGGAAADALLRPGALAEIQKNIGLQRSDAAFNQALARGTSGASAAVEKLKTQEQEALNTPEAAKREVYSQALATEYQSRIASSGNSLMEQYNAMEGQLYYNTLTLFGASPETALRSVADWQADDIGTATRDRALNALRSSIDANTRQLERQNGNPAQQQANAFENR